MKYIHIYDKIIAQECERIKSGKIKIDNSNKRYEWLVIIIALKMPETTIEKMYDEFKKNIEENIEYATFIELLKAVNLDTSSKRRYILNKIKKAAQNFKSFLNGDKGAAKAVAEYIDNLIERDNTDKRMYFKAKYLLTFLFIFDEDFKSNDGELILRNYLEGYCGKILRNIYKKISQQIGLKKTTKEVIESTRRALEATNNEDNNYENSDHEKVIENLKFQVNNYKNALDLVQSMFDELKDSVEESATEAKNATVSEFFTTLNALEYGNILDNLLTVEQRLAKLRTDKVKIQPEVMPLTIIFKQLLRFIKDFGIEPMDEPGREFNAKYEEIALLNYQGEPYVDDKETKKLQVIAPGWKYSDIIISLPTVREV